ncbi:MAG: hypothetical protein AB9891_03550 [Anaerolineaceae bacterium]
MTKQRVKPPAKSDFAKRDSDFHDKICDALGNLQELRGREVLPLFLLNNIRPSTVDEVFETVRERYKLLSVPNSLDIVLESGGGSIDAAYNIGLLLRKYAPKELNFIVPRWAKSAATVLACAGDKIEMTPIAELGPVDPQITMSNEIEKRMEQFSPLDIESTLQLIRDEYQAGHPELAHGLLERLQFPLTLGGIKKSLDVGEQYIRYLLVSRMFKDDEEKAKNIAYKLVHGYSTHAFCIDCDEAKKIRS